MHMIDQICPKYDDLKYMMERYPIITTTLSPNSKGYTLLIEEKWDSEFIRFPNSCRLKKAISWTDQTLKKWKGCRKTSPSTWNFISQKDAEKFQTLFYLSWDKLNIE